MSWRYSSQTKLLALIDTHDNINSMHTNAADEAITTPTEDRVRRAMAIQPIINRRTVPNPKQIELARSTTEEKESQLARLADFHARHAHEAPAMLKRLQQAVIDNGNVFAVLMDAVRCCSLGQITSALFEVGGQYRRSM